MNFVLMVLSFYLIGVFISCLADLKDVKEFNAVVLSLRNENPDLSDVELIKTKLAFAFFIFLMALAWPVRFLFFRNKQTKELDLD